MTPLRSIRQKCLDCSAGSAQEVRLCPVVSCALYPFRLGRNPNRKGLGNKNFIGSRGDSDMNAGLREVLPGVFAVSESQWNGSPV